MYFTENQRDWLSEDEPKDCAVAAALLAGALSGG
jgi:hypothetical protein